MERYVFKNDEDEQFYGVINCMGSPVVLCTKELEEANFYYENEIEAVATILFKYRIFANPVKINFFGNYKPTQDKKAS